MRSRSNIIWTHVLAFINASSCSWPTFATTVREHYEATVEEGYRLIPWSGTRDAYTRARNDAQTLRRFQNDYEHAQWGYDIPADLEEAMVFALQQLKYREIDVLVTELAERMGLLPVRIPVAAPATDLHVVANLMREAAEAIDAMGALTGDDGKIDKNDKAKDLRKAQIELRQVMAAAAGAHELVAQVLNEKGMTFSVPMSVVK